MNKYIKKVFLVLLVCFLMFIIMFFPLLPLIDESVAYGEDINYTFQNDVLVNNTDINEYETYNIRNQTEYTGHYPATYSFENESELTGTDISFVNAYTGLDPTIENIEGHSNVLRVDNPSGYNYVYNYYDSINEGKIELWWYINSSKANWLERIRLGNDTVNRLGVLANNMGSGGSLDWYNEESTENLCSNLGIGWIHVKFEWIGNEINISINGILELENGKFKGSGNSNIARTVLVVQNGHSYFDAIGYSWDSIGYYTFEEFENEEEFDTSVYLYSDWSYGSDADANATIYSGGIDDNYVQLYDTDYNSYTYISSNFSRNIYYGSYSYYYRMTDYATKYLYMYLKQNDDVGIALVNHGDKLKYVDNSIAYDICDIVADTWYSLSINFNCNLGIWNITVNDVFYGNYLFDVEITYANNLYFGTNVLGFTTKADLDTITFEWENDSIYTVGDNLLSTYSTSNIYEVDKFEFNILSENVLNPNGLDNPNTWTDVESAGDSVNINYGKVYMYQASGYNGIQKAFTDTTNKIFNVSFSIDYAVALSTIIGNTTIKIYSSDSTLITYLNLHHNTGYEHTIEYYNGASLVVLNDDYPFDTSVLFLNVYINHYDGICCFRFTQGSTVLRYFVPLIASGKVGLKNVDFINYELSGVLNTPLHLDYIGVYANELSLSNERGYLYQEINDDWNLGHHGLLYINQLTDGFNISVCENEYYLENPDYKHLLEYNALSGFFAGKHYFNVYQNDVYDDACIVVYLKNYIYDVYLGWWEMRGFSTHIQVSGSTLTDDYVPYDDSIFLEFNGTSDYYLVNLFHVENNRLYFNLTCIDTSTEYIQGTFDLTDINCANYSLSLTTRLRGKSFMKGIEYVILGYYTGSDTNILCETSGTRTISQLLKQENLLSSIGFLITDNDNDACSGTTLYGYVDSFKLVYFPNMGYSILSITLIEMMIPLLVIIFPSVGLYVIPKKKQPFVLVLGVAFFSIVCYISSLIPLWLFFIICIALFGVFMGERSSERGDEGW